MFHNVAPLTVTTLLLLLSATTTTTVAKEKPKIWRHGWNTVGDMLYMHGGNGSIISHDATVFTADKYPIVAFDNCYGTADGTQEHAARVTARNLRKVNPDVKNVFYWNIETDYEIMRCSDAGRIWRQHRSEWLLPNATKSANVGYFDFTNPAVRTFWKNHVLSLAYEIDDGGVNDTTASTVVSKPLFDGFFIDGFRTSLSNSDAETQHEWRVGAQQMLKELQTDLNDLGRNQMLVLNGLDDVEWVPAYAEASPVSMVDHFAVLQFLNRTTGEWLYEPMKELLFDVVRSRSNANRTLLVKAWPGPIVSQVDVWPHQTQPKTPEGMRRAALEYLHSALALFLLVAEDTMWFSYSWFWRAGDFVPFGNDHTCPDEFYPAFRCPLGEPLGPPGEAEGGGVYEYAREYEHASVYVDLKDRDATRVIWKSGDPEYCPGAPSMEEEEEVDVMKVVTIDGETTLEALERLCLKILVMGDLTMNNNRAAHVKNTKSLNTWKVVKASESNVLEKRQENPRFSKSEKNNKEIHATYNKKLLKDLQKLKDELRVNSIKTSTV